MRNTGLLLVLALLLNACFNTTRTVQFDDYSGHWDDVKTSILHTWKKSKVDSSTWQMPGSLTIPNEYFSIHEGRNVLYCWDTYFTNAGLLLVDSFAMYAKNAVDNQFAEIEQLGYVPNASEPWAWNRSQTPFLSMMVREVYESSKEKDRDWLLHAYNMLKKDYRFWTDTSSTAIELHKTPYSNLQHFYHHASEKELLDFYKILQPRFNLYDSISKEKMLKIASDRMAEAETGMDFDPRFDGHCPDYVAVCLNSNLYQYEKNFAWMVKELKLQGAPDWNALAEKRKQQLNATCWNEDRGLYLDYDFVRDKQSAVASLASFYPMWTKLASEEQAKQIVKNLPLFEYRFGVAVCEKTTQPFSYQWDYPMGWPPMYYIVTQALDNYGYKEDAIRIAGKYLDVVTKNFLSPSPAGDSVKVRGQMQWREFVPGHVYEKYNVVDGSLKTAEYANRPFHGWSYGVYMWCLNYVEQNEKE